MRMIQTGSSKLVFNDLDGEGGFTLSVMDPAVTVPITISASSAGVSITLADVRIGMTEAGVTIMAEPAMLVLEEAGVTLAHGAAMVNAVDPEVTINEGSLTVL
jgi:hypothetical protein